MRTRWWLISAIAISACVAQAPTAEVAPPAEPLAGQSQEEVLVVPEGIPALDISQHSVPLDQIYFDTFKPI